MTKLLSCQKVISNRRVTIPKELCSQWKIEEGDFVNFVQDETGRIYIVKAEA